MNFLELIRYFLSVVTKSMAWEQYNQGDGFNEIPEASDREITTKYIIDSRYFTKDVGLILGGTILRGSIKLNQQMMFGPDRNGNFKHVVVKGIHENRVPI